MYFLYYNYNLLSVVSFVRQYNIHLQIETKSLALSILLSDNNNNNNNNNNNKPQLCNNLGKNIFFCLLHFGSFFTLINLHNF